MKSFLGLKAMRTAHGLSGGRAALLRRQNIEAERQLRPTRFMKRNRTAWKTAIGLCGVCLSLAAAEVTTLDSLKKELQELRARTQLLEQKILDLERGRSISPSRPDAPSGVSQGSTVPSGSDKGAPTAKAPSQRPVPAKHWSAADPQPLFRSGSAYMNISFSTLFDIGGSTESDVTKELQLGGHDPVQNGFSLPNAEIALDGAVDPYFKAAANMVLKLDQEGETEFELEEAFLQTLSLPANLQAKAGQFYAEFGRQNPQHPHQWAFVDQPLVLNRMFGPDGLRNPGARLSWLIPTPFYSELFLGLFNGAGETAFSFRASDSEGTHGREPDDSGLSGFDDLLYVPRLAVSFDLGDQQTLMLGTSAAFGANTSGQDRHTQVYGLDALWKWKSSRANQGFPFVSWQTEILARRYETGADLDSGLSAETLRDWGLYSQILWGIRPRWVAGLRGEYAHGNRGEYDPEDVFRGERWRVSPNLTWYPSEFSKIRLQYNLDQGERFDYAHSVWLQVEFLLGAHAAHKF